MFWLLAALVILLLLLVYQVYKIGHVMGYAACRDDTIKNIKHSRLTVWPRPRHSRNRAQQLWHQCAAEIDRAKAADKDQRTTSSLSETLDIGIEVFDSFTAKLTAEDKDDPS